MSSTPAPSEPQKKWSGFGYEPVPGLINRHISRYLRTQRRNMRRFFVERGLLELAMRLDSLRKQSNRNFVQKNRAFQRILNEYIKLATPTNSTDAAGVAVEAGPTVQPGELDLRTAGAPVAVPGADVLADDGGRVPEVASDDGAGHVIEE